MNFFQKKKKKKDLIFFIGKVLVKLFLSLQYPDK